MTARKPPARYSAIEGALASCFATSVTCNRCGDKIVTTREAFEIIRVRQRHYSLGTLYESHIDCSLCSAALIPDETSRRDVHAITTYKFDLFSSAHSGETPAMPQWQTLSEGTPQALTALIVRLLVDPRQRRERLQSKRERRRQGLVRIVDTRRF